MAITPDLLAKIALDAGAIIMEIYNGAISVSQKDDESPVTEADTAAEVFILDALMKADPSLPIIAEESVSAGVLPTHGPRFALVDPVDGTREFIKRNGEFTVNIAIIEHGRPTMAVVYAPAMERLFVADTHDYAWEASAKPGDDVPRARKRLTIRKAPVEGPIAFASKSHRSPETAALLKSYNITKTLSAGSSIKFCLIAAGEADLYPRLGRTMEWDTAAGHAIVEAAGGRVMTIDNTPLLYGKTTRDYDNPHFIVFGDVSPQARLA